MGGLQHFQMWVIFARAIPFYDFMSDSIDKGVEVIFNRMTSELYPDTLYDVLSQNKPVQFASWKRRDKAQPTEKEYDSIYNVLNGNTDLLRNDTMYFSTYPLTSNLDVKICCHSFCY